MKQKLPVVRLWLTRRFVRLARLSITVAERLSPELFKGL